jgi:hypothetical protein
MLRPTMGSNWCTMDLANGAFDLVVKIAAILAAVAAINLLGPKPHLVAALICHVTADTAANTKA